MCGYFSGFATLMLFSFIFKYWSTECRTPVMLRSFFNSTVTWWTEKQMKREWLYTVWIALMLKRAETHLFADHRLEIAVEQHVCCFCVAMICNSAHKVSPTPLRRLYSEFSSLHVTALQKYWNQMIKSLIWFDDDEEQQRWWYQDVCNAVSFIYLIQKPTLNVFVQKFKRKFLKSSKCRIIQHFDYSNWFARCPFKEDCPASPEKESYQAIFLLNSAPIPFSIPKQRF